MGTFLEVEDSILQYIGKIDAALISAKWKNVKAEVFLTDERICHILERHKEDYENFGIFIPNALEHPKYILEDRKNENTALYIGDAANIGISVVVKIAFLDDEARILLLSRCIAAVKSA